MREYGLMTLSTNEPLLLAARGLQGLGAAMASPASRVMRAKVAQFGSFSKSQ